MLAPTQNQHRIINHYMFVDCHHFNYLRPSHSASALSLAASLAGMPAIVAARVSAFWLESAVPAMAWAWAILTVCISCSRASADHGMTDMDEVIRSITTGKYR